MDGMAGRLLQLRQLGIQTCSVEAKIAREAQTQTGDGAWIFGTHHKVVKAMKRLPKHRDQNFEAVLFMWEAVESCAKKASEMGHLVFSDMTTTRFVVVEIARTACVHLT
ncbi:hypothetical protein WJX72_011626 [[Myrmecia] bisecta]|uniref:Uncharacterized protein n=1 Tax=[Myrmecia] bisecta TaxID=41462 RepID=A0AAW1QGN0_9CHLO